MRAYGGVALALFVLALLAQIFSPVSAGFAMARASDPFSSPIICTHDGGTQQIPSGPQFPDESCCGSCCLAHAVVAPVAPSEFIIVALAIPAYALFPSPRAFVPLIWRNGSAARPRAPPSLS